MLHPLVTQRDRRLPRVWLTVIAVLGVPLVAFFLLRSNTRLDFSFGTPLRHFYIVTAVAATALGLALAVGWAARSLPDARTFFLALGFLSMAGIFLAHGAGMAPFGGKSSMPSAASSAAMNALPAAGEASQYGYGAPPAAAATTAPADDDDAMYAMLAVGFSARLSLMVSALCFVLAVANLGARASAFVVRRWVWLAAASAAVLIAYIGAAVFAPAYLMWIPMTSALLSWAVAIVAWAGFAFAGWRFWQAYQLARLPLQGAMALSMGLLAEAQFFMLRGPLWHLSWWEYHIAMLAGFLIAVGGLLAHYRMAGDLGAVVEGLFLRQQVDGLRHGDPRVLTALVAAVSAKDSETDAHTERVSALALGIGAQFGLPAEDLEILRWAGRLHDLGKIGVPNNILRKPDALTEREFRVIQVHSERGWRVAVRSSRLAAVAPIIRAHHERLDGSGYPDGLVGEAIPLAARIISVADVWDALTCDRPYRKAMSHEAAAAILRREAGPHLDVDCVAALFAYLAATQSLDPAVDTGAVAA